MMLILKHRDRNMLERGFVLLEASFLCPYLWLGEGVPLGRGGAFQSGILEWRDPWFENWRVSK